MEKLKPGDKYLSIQILGKNGINVAAFKNPKKADNPKAPDYTGNGVAVWITEKREEKEGI